MNLVSKTSLYFSCILFTLILLGCTPKTKQTPDYQTNTNIDYKKQEAIIHKHLIGDAWKYPLYSQERQAAIDRGLAKDSTIAYLWQQKAMPLFKQRKYELGLQFLNKAVHYDREAWQDYRAFMKCIFMKNYRDALSDFQDCKQRYGNNYVMDHSYDFYSALCYLQLNQFEKAKKLLQQEVQKQIAEHGKDWVHYLDVFYLGISEYETKQYTAAITTFDKVLALYPNFAEALHYKAICLEKLEKIEEAQKLYADAKQQGNLRNTFNEDNTVYELYPYQIRWQ